MIGSLLAVVIFLCIIDLYLKYNEKTRILRNIPGPKENFLVGHSLNIISCTPVELFSLAREYARRFNGIYIFYAFLLRTVNIYNPEDVETVISSVKHNAKGPAYTVLKPWLRTGLLLSDGLKWQQRRKILTPSFHFNILNKFFVTLEENSSRLVDTLLKTRGESVDMVTVISEYTLNSICETAMGTRLDDEANNEEKRKYKEAVNKLGKLCVERFVRVLYFQSDFLFNFSSLGRNTRKYVDRVSSFTKKVISEREKFIGKFGTQFYESVDRTFNEDVYMVNKKKKAAMLDLLLAAEKEGVIDRNGVQEEVDTFTFEGHDTTAIGLTYCLMSIANHKNIQDKIVAELQDIFGVSTRPATMEDLSMMRYLERCIQESLRLYPPVPFISRILTETVKLSNYTVPAGTACQIYVYDLHRREDQFKNAQVFDPDRFLPENSKHRHPYAYIPFSAGQRNCIGQRFAMMEMKSCLAAVLRKFELFPVTQPCELEFASDLVLRNTGPVYVKFVARQP